MIKISNAWSDNTEIKNINKKHSMLTTAKQEQQEQTTVLIRVGPGYKLEEKMRDSDISSKHHYQLTCIKESLISKKFTSLFIFYL